MSLIGSAQILRFNNVDGFCMMFAFFCLLSCLMPYIFTTHYLRKKRERQEIEKNCLSNTSHSNLVKKFQCRPYEKQKCVIATMHGKEQAIEPAFSSLLGFEIIESKLNTDEFGTFSGEVERKGSALDCARSKCEVGMRDSDANAGVASEGSFGPHPHLPFIACDHEILYFIDKERNFAIHHSTLSTKTNYSSKAISDLTELKSFSNQALFPSHGLMLRPSKSNKKNFIIKGIQTYDVLENAFLKCCRLSEDGKALVETDMRAHMNPTRMGVIKELANSFAMRLSTLCPRCNTPGWGLVGTEKGLECEICKSETEMVKTEIFGCAKCLYNEKQSRQDGLAYANPQYCGWCNP